MRSSPRGAAKGQSPGNFQVKFTTTRGDFVVTVNRAWAPIGADRFYNLVKHRFYDSASFFRVVPGVRGAVWHQRLPAGVSSLGEGQYPG